MRNRTAEPPRQNRSPARGRRWTSRLRQTVVAVVIVAGLYYVGWDRDPVLPERGAPGRAIDLRASMAADDFRGQHSGEAAEAVLRIYPSVNADGTPDYLVLVDTGGTPDFDPRVLSAEVRAFLRQHRGMDFSRGYSMVMYTLEGDELHSRACARCPEYTADGPS